MLRALFVVVAALSTTAGCSCDPPPPDVPLRAAGSIEVAVSGTTATVTLSSLDAPLRTLQVDVAVDGGKATSATGIGPWNIVEAGLAASPANPAGGPKDRFTLVVADTRRLPISDGALARLVVDDGAKVTLLNALAVDANGTQRPLLVVDR
jgi:hypothetical protein